MATRGWLDQQLDDVHQAGPDDDRRYIGVDGDQVVVPPPGG